MPVPLIAGPGSAAGAGDAAQAGGGRGAHAPCIQVSFYDVGMRLERTPCHEACASLCLCRSSLALAVLQEQEMPRKLAEAAVRMRRASARLILSRITCL